MKKLYLLGLSLLGIASLASCDLEKDDDGKASIVYTNEEGEEVTYEFTKTDDSKKVEEAVEIISQLETNTSYTGVKVSGSASLVIDGTYEGEKVGMDMSGKCDITANNSDLTLSVDSILSTDVYASVEYSQKMVEGSTTETHNLRASAYLDNKIAYVDYTADTTTTKLSLNLSTLLAGYQDQIDQIEGMLGDVNNIEDILGETSLSDLIEQYKVSISSTAKDTVVFKVEYPLSELGDDFKDLALDIYVGWDLKVNSFKSISVKDSTIFKTYMEAETGGTYTKCDLELNINIEYGNYSVTKLSDTDKLEYFDFSSMLQ